MKIPLFMLTDTVTVEEYIGNNAYGQSYKQPYELAVRLEEKQKIVKNTMGNQIVSETLLISNQYIPIGSKIAFNQKETEVIECNLKTGFGNVSHYEVRLK